MVRVSSRRAILAGTALALVATTAQVQAGGFALREQSAYYQGIAFAGAAAGGGPSLSSMFWNPATMTQHKAWMQFEQVATIVHGTSSITPTAATSATGASLLGLGGSGNVSETVIIPSGYTVYRPNDRWALGVAFNAPFGLATRPNFVWAGQFYGRDSEVFSVNMTPQVAVQLDNWISVGVGLQVQYFYVELDQAFPSLAGPIGNLKLQGDGIGVGFTAGVTLTPSPWTTIGIGYRSGIEQGIDGSMSRPAFTTLVGGVPTTFAATTAAIRANIPLPQMVNVGVRQKVTEQLTLMGTVEWTDWSRLSTVGINVAVPAPLLATVPTALPFQWDDGWFASFGAEYQWSPVWAFRAGIGFEWSPLNDRVRTVRLADNDRIWVGLGATYNWNERISFDVGYTHIFVQDAPINIVPGHPTFTAASGTFVGSGETSVDILALGFRYKFVPPPSAIITKG
jgi:long-chain fatty acid transport protein